MASLVFVSFVLCMCRFCENRCLVCDVEEELCYI